MAATEGLTELPTATPLEQYPSTLRVVIFAPRRRWWGAVRADWRIERWYEVAESGRIIDILARGTFKPEVGKELDDGRYRVYRLVEDVVDTGETGPGGIPIITDTRISPGDPPRLLTAEQARVLYGGER